MAPAVLYEEEVDLQAEAVVETGLSPEVTVATTTANPVTAPAVPVVAQASPAMIEAWKNQRPALVEQVARAEQEYKNHTGTAEFDAYVASNACSAMMGRLRSEAFKGVERKLAILWGKLFVGSLPDMVMRAFRQYLRVEVFPRIYETQMRQTHWKGFSFIRTVGRRPPFGGLIPAVQSL